MYNRSKEATSSSRKFKNLSSSRGISIHVSSFPNSEAQKSSPTENSSGSYTNNPNLLIGERENLPGAAFSKA